MKATELKAIAALLAPSLSDANFAPILSKLCFVDGLIYAYNDTVATIFEWEHGLGEFAVDGKAFSQLVANLGDDEVSLKLEKGALHIACGTAKAKLPVSGKDEFVFEMPEGWEAGFKATLITDAEKDRLLECLEAVAPSSVNKIYESIVLTGQMGELSATATDGTVLIHGVIGKMQVKSATPKVKHWIVPKLAVKQMLSASQAKQAELTLYMTNDVIVATCEGIIICSSLIHEDVPDLLEYIKFDTRATIKGWRTDKLLRGLAVAAVMQDSYSTMLHVSVDSKGLKLASKGKDGEATDQVGLTEIDLEENTSFRINPALVRNAFKFKSLNETSLLKVGQNCLTFGDQSKFIYGVAFEQEQ